MIKTLKKLLLMMVLCSIAAMAQAPQRMSYQAVVRDATGNLVVSTMVGVRIGLLHNSPSGEVVYSETHSVMTNENGLFTLQIGGGAVLSGNFSAIDWSVGTYFVKTETDPAGGTNYTISGTSQLLSVPFALYALKSGNNGGGRTSIFITGDITNEAAQAKIDAEFGTNTENIYIVRTGVLSAIDLSPVMELANLIIENNNSLSTIDLSNLKSINNKFSCVSNPVLNNIALPQFETLISSMDITNNSALSQISMPHAAKILGNLTITKNNALASVNLSGIFYCSNDIKVRDNAQLLALDFSGLTTMGFVSISCSNLNQLTIQNLVQGALEVDKSKLVTLNLPVFASGNLSVTSNSLLTNISLPVFTTAYNYFTVSNNATLPAFTAPLLVSGEVVVNYNALLASVSLPNFVSSITKIDISKNPSLTSISFPLFSGLTGPFAGTDFNFERNHFASAQVNEIIHMLLTATPAANKFISLRQIPPAPPTGQGIIDKQTINVNNTIYTD